MAQQPFASGAIHVMKFSFTSCARFEELMLGKRWDILVRFQGDSYLVKVPEGTEDACVEQAKKISGIRTASRCTEDELRKRVPA